MSVPASVRNRLIKLIHVAKRELSLDDENYRALLESVTGKTSSKDMDVTELNAVLAAMRRSGFGAGSPPAPLQKGGGRKFYSPASRHKEKKSQADKVRALWITLGQRGIVRDPSEAALNKFCKRVCGCDRLDWATSRQANRLIEALKEMGERGSNDG